MQLAFSVLYIFFSGGIKFLKLFLLPPVLSTFNFTVKMKGILEKTALTSTACGKIWGRNKNTQNVNAWDECF